MLLGEQDAPLQLLVILIVLLGQLVEIPGHLVEVAQSAGSLSQSLTDRTPPPEAGRDGGGRQPAGWLGCYWRRGELSIFQWKI